MVDKPRKLVRSCRGRGNKQHSRKNYSTPPFCSCSAIFFWQDSLSRATFSVAFSSMDFFLIVPWTISLKHSGKLGKVSLAVDVARLFVTHLFQTDCRISCFKQRKKKRAPRRWKVCVPLGHKSLARTRCCVLWKYRETCRPLPPPTVLTQEHILQVSNDFLQIFLKQN